MKAKQLTAMLRVWSRLPRILACLVMSHHFINMKDSLAHTYQNLRVIDYDSLLAVCFHPISGHELVHGNGTAIVGK